MKVNFSKSYIKKIGDKLRHGVLLSQQEELDLSSFRFSYRYIMEFFFRKHVELLSTDKWKNRKIVLAARLKKRATIVSKLSSRLTEMNLSRMHDIAGCRLIFQNVDDLYNYRNAFINKLSEENSPYMRINADDKYDYIKNPQETGYRSVHDVYAETEVRDGIAALIEIQYRTIVQHSWSTALEIWDNVHAKGAKFGQESREITIFFRDVGELFWRTLDSKKGGKGLLLSNRRLYSEIATIDRKYSIINFFKGVRRSDDVDLFSLNEENNVALIRRHKAFLDGLGDVLEKTTRLYSREELQNLMLQNEADKDADSVWVCVNGQNFAKAYNNYYNDARRFRKNLAKSLKRTYDNIVMYKRIFVTGYKQLVAGLTYDDIVEPTQL